ncbi:MULTISPECIES: DUF4912 domain-containing protein [Paenibacillus]|uniref:DUF4912 domain-containing protein n=1 Tax=Paenibacillus TaxID=44249 RepID=UPI00227EF3DC|nr:MULTISPECIES: DUF4912 domain-containing protein [Paenibacillus]MCY7484813.1 DUF4912 domain-containing protein [Paenibacillus alvei]
MQLLLKDPYTLFAYWFITARTQVAVERHYRMKWSELKKAIQLYEIKQADLHHCKLGTSNHVLLHTVESHEGSVYLRPLKPYHSYIADYGFMTATHSFVPLARSTIIHTPYLQTYGELSEQMDHALQAVQLGQSETEALFPSFSSYTLYENREGVRE